MKIAESLPRRPDTKVPPQTQVFLYLTSTSSTAQATSDSASRTANGILRSLGSVSCLLRMPLRSIRSITGSLLRRRRTIALRAIRV